MYEPEIPGIHPISALWWECLTCWQEGIRGVPEARDHYLYTHAPYEEADE